MSTQNELDTQGVEFKNDARNFVSLDRHPNIPKLKVRSLSDTLRVVGVISLLCSGLFFMLQGLVVLSSFERFISFACVAVGLGVLGLFTGAQMKEPKSARAFLGLAAAATPVLYSQIGAMIYSQFAAQTMVPDAFVVIAPSLFLTVLAGGLFTLFMAPVLYIGFGAFYRERAQQLVLFLLMCSATLLIPTRASNLSAMLIFAQLAMLYAFDNDRLKKSTVLIETEKSFAKLILLIPVAIMIGRGLFYQPTELFFSSVAAAVSLISFCFIPMGRLLFLGGVGAGLSWFFALDAFLSLNPAFEFVRIFVAGYSAAVGVLLFAQPNTGVTSRKFLRFFGQMFAFYIPVFCFFSSWSAPTAIVAILLGLIASALGYMQRDLGVFRSGALVGGFGIFYFGTHIWQLAWNVPWISLASIGIVVILLAGYIEKHRMEYAPLKKRFQDHFAFSPAEEIAS